VQATWLETFQHHRAAGEGTESMCGCSESCAIQEIPFGLFLLMFTENGGKEIPLVSAPGLHQLVPRQSCLLIPWGCRGFSHI